MKPSFPWVGAASAGLLGLIYIVVYAVLFTDGYSEQLRTVVVTSVVSGGLGAYYGYWLNSSADQAKKDELPAPPATVTTTVTTLPASDEVPTLSDVVLKKEH